MKVGFGKSYYFLFEDEDGEQFVVEERNLEEAWKIAKEYFGNNTEYIGEVDEYDAMISGCDIY